MCLIFTGHWTSARVSASMKICSRFLGWATLNLGIHACIRNNAGDSARRFVTSACPQLSCASFSSLTFLAMRETLQLVCQKFRSLLTELGQQFSVNPAKAAVAENHNHIAALHDFREVRDDGIRVR